MATLKIGLPNQEALESFTSWLCEAGEQDYWEFMDCQDEETLANKVDFSYNTDNTITTTLSEKEDE